jgi:hypothetical protein
MSTPKTLAALSLLDNAGLRIGPLKTILSRSITGSFCTRLPAIGVSILAFATAIRCIS